MTKSLDLWLPAWLRQKSRPTVDGVTDIMLAVCDHFEPRHGADKSTALQRIRRWQQEFPPLVNQFHDADGVRPRHTFFYPIEQYDPDIVTEVAKLAALCGGEVEMHLHHENDSNGRVREKLERGKRNLAQHHLLPRDKYGNIHYGFIHGDWALDNSHPQGLHCGVDDEIGVLAETGCYADFTMPSAPDPTQTRTINSIYYAPDTPEPKSHDIGIPARVGTTHEQQHSLLLLVQGPLGLNWQRRKFGLLPRIENGELSAANPPRPDRMKLWAKIGVHVQGRPEWIFIKLHTHGGIERNMTALLGEPMSGFFAHALAEYNDSERFRLHFVTTREMVNIIRAAEDGQTGDPGQFRDYRLTLPE